MRPGNTTGREHSKCNGSMMAENGWSEYQKMVLHRLDDNDRSLLGIDARLRTIENRIERIGERLSLTAGVMGFAAGTIPSIIILFM